MPNGNAIAFATFYLAGALGALATFPWRVAGFDPGAFVALSTVHLFAAVFAVTFSAAVATVFQHKLVGMLVSISILGTLVGIAFLGFYYPALRTVSHLNPFFDGIVLIGRVENYGAWDILFPILVLIAFNLAVAAFGRRRAAALIDSVEHISHRRSDARASAVKLPPGPAREDTPFVSLLRVEAGRAIGQRHWAGAGNTLSDGSDAGVLAANIPSKHQTVLREHLRPRRLAGHRRRQ